MAGAAVSRDCRGPQRNLQGRFQQNRRLKKRESFSKLSTVTFRKHSQNCQALHNNGFFSILQSFFTERVFQIFDKDNSGTISLPEFIDAMHQFSGKTPDDKIRFLFKVYDLDGKFSDFIIRTFQAANRV